MNSPTDKDLFEQIKRDDKTAFRALFDRHYRVMLGTAINILKNEDKGKDVVQDVFFKIWKNRANLELKTSAQAYLKRAVINQAINQVKAAKSFVEEEQLLDKPSDLESAIDKLALEELETAVDAALGTLPERCRLIFVMKRLEGMSHNEIAEMLNISPKTIENQITKAMKVMKVALQLYRKKKSP